MNETVALVRLNEIEFGDQAESMEPEELEAEVERCRSALNASLLSRYTHMKRRFGSRALVEAADHVCAACRMALPLTQISRLSEGKIITCDHCGRLLYNPDAVYMFR